MRSILVLGAVAASIAPATAGETVWGTIELGMTRAAVEAAYPKGGKIEYNGDGSIEIADVRIIDKCEAEVNIYFVDGVVDSVKIAGNPSMGGRCSDTVLSGLASKYGEPLSVDRTGSTLASREGRVSIWNRPGGMTMRFKKFTSGMWGGGGLLKASWELLYTNTGQDLAL